MKIRKDLDLCVDDFWYDLTQGGYIDPKKLCINDEDIKEVNDAINVLSDFEKAIMEAYGN